MSAGQHPSSVCVSLRFALPTPVAALSSVASKLAPSTTHSLHLWRGLLVCGNFPSFTAPSHWCRSRPYSFVTVFSFFLCPTHVRGEFLAFWEVWGLLPPFSRCSVGVVPHIDAFLMHLWVDWWSPFLTLLPSWSSASDLSSRLWFPRRFLEYTPGRRQPVESPWPRPCPPNPLQATQLLSVPDQGDTVSSVSSVHASCLARPPGPPPLLPGTSGAARPLTRSPKPSIIIFKVITSSFPLEYYYLWSYNLFAFQKLVSIFYFWTLSKWSHGVSILLLTCIYSYMLFCLNVVFVS